jgi:uncharacterized protein (TIGR03118 family)
MALLAKRGYSALRLTDHISTARLRMLAALAATPVLLAAATTDAGAASGHNFAQTNLVSDQSGVAATTDPNLVNPWGLVASATSPWWVADNGTGLSTLYNGTGGIVPLVVSVPAPATPPAGLIPGASGIVFNGGANFVVSNGTTSGPAAFIFSTEDGTISGWSPAVDRTHAIRTVDNFGGGKGAVYKGLALAANSAGQQQLFATNFRSGRVDVFDTSFKPVENRFAFFDPFIPDGFAPFGIDLIQNKLFVSYAKQNATKDADVAGNGNGFIDVFNTDGRLLQKFASRGALNSPWGMVVAPAGFGAFGGDLLVGNFGNGHVHAFKMDDDFFNGGHFAGTLDNAQGKTLAIDGLWSLQFGNGAGAGPATTLFFTAGPNAQTHGLLGTLLPSS